MTLPPEETMWTGRYIVAKRRGPWEYATRARNIGAAAIVAIEDDHVLLVEQFRVPLGRNCVELPAGLVGDETEGEDVVASARRELEEETGYRADTVEVVGTFASSSGMIGETITLVRARGLTKVSEGGGIAGEGITVHRVPLSGFDAFVADKRAQGCAVDVKLLALMNFVQT